MIGTKLFGWYLASVGLLEAEAFLYPQTIAVQQFVFPVSLTSKEELRCKIVFEKASGRLLGVQLLSKANFLDLINRCGWAIEQKMTLEEWLDQDFFFQSQYSHALTFLNAFILGRDRDEI